MVDPDINCTDSLTIHLSNIVFNQAHEQYNVVVYVDRSVISLTKDTVAHRRWILAGPEFRGLIERFLVAHENVRIKTSQGNASYTEIILNTIVDILLVVSSK